MTATPTPTWNVLVDAHHDLVGSASDTLLQRLLDLIEKESSAAEDRKAGMASLVCIALSQVHRDPKDLDASEPRRILDWKEVRDLDHTRGHFVLARLAKADEVEMDAFVRCLDRWAWPAATTGVHDTFWGSWAGLALLPFNAPDGPTRQDLVPYRRRLADTQDPEEMSHLLQTMEAEVRSRFGWKQDWDALQDVLEQMVWLARSGWDMEQWPQVMHPEGAGSVPRVEVLVAAWVTHHVLHAFRTSTGPGAPFTPRGIGTTAQDLLTRWGYPTGIRQILQQRKKGDYDLLLRAMKNTFDLV